jgi:broad specificity phosphatase PhoE
MSELYLVRHAQASFGAGNYDVLSELGHRQALWLGEYFGFRELSFDRVICGDMARHQETAEGILKGMGLEPTAYETESAWNEFDFEAIIHAFLEQHPGEAPPENALVRDFSRILRKALLAWSGDRLTAPVPETFAHFESRVQGALTSMTRQAGSRRRLLVVSSGGAIASVLRYALEAPPHVMVHLNLQLRNSGVNQVFFNAEQLHLGAFNHVPHLDRPDRYRNVTYF